MFRSSGFSVCCMFNAQGKQYCPEATCQVSGHALRMLVRGPYFAHARDESLSQRYFCVAAVKALLPTVTTVVHDDACHLHKYCARRAAHSQAAAQLSPPHMTFVCDKFHMAGHTDAWCKQTCDPELPSNSALLAGVRTSVCEFTFTWLSKYKHQTKHMNEYGFQFFLLDMAWSHNEIILQGGYRPEEVAGSLDAEDVA